MTAEIVGVVGVGAFCGASTLFILFMLGTMIRWEVQEWLQKRAAKRASEKLEREEKAKAEEQKREWDARDRFNMWRDDRRDPVDRHFALFWLWVRLEREELHDPHLHAIVRREVEKVRPLLPGYADWTIRQVQES